MSDPIYLLLPLEGEAGWGCPQLARTRRSAPHPHPRPLPAGEGNRKTQSNPC